MHSFCLKVIGQPDSKQEYTLSWGGNPYKGFNYRLSGYIEPIFMGERENDFFIVNAPGEVGGDTT